MSFTLYVLAPEDGINSLTISYGGSSYRAYPAGTSTSCHTNTVADGTQITITPSIPSGYQFSRWVRNADGAVTYSYSSTLSYTPASGVSTVYLRVEVEEVSTYYATLKFNANGGSGAPSSMTDYNTGSSTITFTIPDETPTRSGYTFEGWEVTYTGGSTIYQPGDTASVEGTTSGITYTLYAVWEEIPTYYATLSFDANGGSGAPSSITNSTVGSSTVVFTIPTTVPTRSGYTFTGWKVTYTGGSTVYQPGNTARMEGTTSGITYTLVAQWTENAGGAHIYSSGWNDASVYVYSGGWKKATPYVYANGWKKGV